MVSHKAFFTEHADEYYQTLENEKVARTFERELTGDDETNGKLTLRMMIMPEFHRRVAMVRQTGMKIKDKGNISGLFRSLDFVHEGDALNAYLRSLENPNILSGKLSAQTINLSPQLLFSKQEFIKECLERMKKDDTRRLLDPSVGEFIFLLLKR